MQDKSRTKTYSQPDLEKAMGILGVDKLSQYREQVGISDVTELAPRRPVPNIGIYKRIAREEKKARNQYYCLALLINTCLLAQIVLASALTALGAGNGSHTQITALGVANTVVAAMLTFTKGQGLPNKLRQYQNTLRKVREYIEQRERDFALVDCKLELNYEIGVIRAMYEAARQHDENKSDSESYNNASTPFTVARTEGPQPTSSTPRHISPSDRRMSGMGNEAKEEVIERNESSRGEPVKCNQGSVEKSEAVIPEVWSRFSRRGDGLPLQSSPQAHTEDPARWKMAYSVADRLVSSKHPW
ncbi:hypothetical protein MMC21_002871 [Puttea exsequens]|nr:hypothetical protein [Puttea exsequens]